MDKSDNHNTLRNSKSAGLAVKMKKIYIFCSIQLMTVLAIMLALEIGVRLFADPIAPVDINSQTIFTAEGQEPFFQYHPFAAFSWIPNARFLRQTVNSKGFVSTREIPLEKVDNEIRIITLGGSSTVGNGNVDEQTYPRILERLLQEKFPERKINVINAAAGGYSTRESLGYLQSRLIYYNPDIIIVMHGWNDMYYFTKTDEELSEWRKDFNLQAMWNSKVAVKLKDLMPADLQYLSWSQLYLHLRAYMKKSTMFGGAEGANTVEKRYEGLDVDSEGNPVFTMKKINSKGFETYKNNLEQIYNICRNNGIQVYSILQPTLFSKTNQVINDKLKRAVETAMAYHAFDYRTHINVFQKLYDINRDVAGPDNIVDATGMNGKGQFFFDHIHQSPYGTQALAELVFDIIIEKHK